MDEDADAALSRAEILHFFRDARALAVRRKALYAVSEWTDTPEWMPALREVFVNEPEAAEALYTAQIQPTLWWSVAVARHAGLPRDGEVYHYQPITFIKWMNERMRSAPPPAAQPSQGQLKPKQKLKDDWDDEDGESFASEEDFRTVGGGVDLTLEEAAEGYK